MQLTSEVTKRYLVLIVTEGDHIDAEVIALQIDGRTYEMSVGAFCAAAERPQEENR